MSKEVKKSKTFSFKYLAYDIMRILGAPGLLFFRPKKYYISEKAKKHIKGGTLIISNHISIHDPMYLMHGIWYRRLRFVAMSELFASKFSRWLFTNIFLCIEIDRNNFNIMTFKEIVSHLQAGEAVAMFPEGHVNADEKGTQTFKSGMTVMALRSGCPIVPVYIKRRKHWYSRLVFAIGEPINVKDFCEGVPNINDVNRATEYLQEQEKKLAELCGE